MAQEEAEILSISLCNMLKTQHLSMHSDWLSDFWHQMYEAARYGLLQTKQHGVYNFLLFGVNSYGPSNIVGALWTVGFFHDRCPARHTSFRMVLTNPLTLFHHKH